MRERGTGRRRGRNGSAIRGSLLAAVTVLVTACGAGSTGTPDDAGRPTGTAAAPGDATSGDPAPSSGPLTNTVTSTVTPPASTAQPPSPTAEPAAVDGTCPYLTDDQAADINGQHTGPTQIVDVAPHPVCTFTRSDGGWLATVRIVEAATPAEAVAAVNQHVPIDHSSPANQPAGWSGGAVVLDDRSVYAVAKDRYAVIAESNQLQTIKGRQMAITAISTLGL